MALFERGVPSFDVGIATGAHPAIVQSRQVMIRASMLALCAAAALAAAPAKNPVPPLTQAEADAAVAAVLPHLQEIRGITFKRKVPVSVIDDAKARAYALTRFRRLTPESKIRSDDLTFHLLGLVPKDVDVLKTLLDVLEEQAGGFYDPDSKSFYLLDDMPRSMTSLLTAHEMTHALEDQRYDIDGRIAKVLDDDDRSFALSALVEGSATIAAAVWVEDAVAAGTLDAKAVAGMGDLVKTERLNAMPASLRRQLVGPYALGMEFLARGTRDGLASGFPKAAVDAAWAHPPLSSEQILHPEKYWDPAQRDDPRRVEIPDPSAVFGAGWARAGAGVLGELTLGSLVGAPTPSPNELAAGGSRWTNAAASGWGGDRFELWTRRGDAVVLVATVWDTEKDAIEFAAALPPATSGIAAQREGARVGIVAGAAGDRRAALLALLVKP
jgi:hypothetical protein